MLSDDQLTAARSTAQRLLTSACTVRRASGEPVFDPNTGQYTVPAGTVIYSGSCHIRPAGGERVVEFGGRPVSLRTYSVRLPVGSASAGVTVEDEVEITTSADPDLQGRRLRVLDAPGDSRVITRRLIVEEMI